MKTLDTQYTVHDTLNIKSMSSHNKNTDQSRTINIIGVSSPLFGRCCDKVPSRFNIRAAAIPPGIWPPVGDEQRRPSSVGDDAPTSTQRGVRTISTCQTRPTSTHRGEMAISTQVLTSTLDTAPTTST